MPAGGPARQDALGVAHDADRADGVPGVVEDRRRRRSTRRARPRRARARRRCSRIASSSLRSAAGVSVRRVSFGSASASRSSTSSAGAKARIALPSALACDRQLRADLEDLQRGVRPEDVVDDDDAGAVQDADADGGVGARGQPLGVDDRAAAQLVEVEVGVAELEQAGAELVLVGVAVLLDEAVRLQRLQQAVDRGRAKLEPVGELADAEAARPARERLQDARRAVDGLDRPSLRPLCYDSTLSNPLR